MKLDRRSFIACATVSLSADGWSAEQAMSKETRSALVMPDESHSHKGTWMAYVANDSIWSKQQIPQVKQDLALIAKTIAKYEPVFMLVASRDMKEAQSVFREKTRFPIQLIPFETDDLWLRDTGPVFVISTSGNKRAINFNFNGWGNKQTHKKDKLVASYIAKYRDAEMVETHLTLEGGCFEVDGQGTAIMTRSCIVNDNRNPNLSEREIEKELKSLLGLEKIIWLDGVKGKDITDGHTDFYARFVRAGKVVVGRENFEGVDDYRVTRENIAQLQQSTDAQGKKLDLKIIDAPKVINNRFGEDDFASGYLGYYVCNDAVIVQQFGDKQADELARDVIQSCFPERKIEQIYIDGIASGGGTIHCATQQEI